MIVRLITRRALQIQDYKMSKYDITMKGGEGTTKTSNMAGIVHGGMGNTSTTNHSKENRQQTYNIENAQGVVGGQDMRGASVNQGGITGPRSGPIAYFEGKGNRQITNQGNIGNIATGDNHSGNMVASCGVQPGAGGTRVPGPALELMTVDDVQDLMTRERFPEPTRKTFEENGIDGKYFVKLLEVGVLEALGVTSPLDKMKINTILENRSKKSS